MFERFWKSRREEEQLAAELARKEREERVIKHNTDNFRKGGLAVLASGSFTILAAVLCRRSVIARRYAPKQFNANHIPPKFNPMQDAAKAVVDATMLATSFFAFIMSSAFWINDAGSLKEFGGILTNKFGSQREVPSSEEDQKIEKKLTDLLFSKQPRSKDQ